MVYQNAATYATLACLWLAYCLLIYAHLSIIGPPKTPSFCASSGTFPYILWILIVSRPMAFTSLISTDNLNMYLNTTKPKTYLPHPIWPIYRDKQLSSQNQYLILSVAAELAYPYRYIVLIPISWYQFQALVHGCSPGPSIPALVDII